MSSTVRASFASPLVKSRPLALLGLACLSVCSAATIGCGGAPATETTASSASLTAGISEGAGDPPLNEAAAPANSVVGSQAVVSEVQSILTTLKSTRYDHKTDVDVATGLYDVDCSGLVDYVLSTALSDAYDTLTANTVERPLAESYVSFILALRAPEGRWNKIIHVDKLVAGDLVGWRTPSGVVSNDTGHVMIVRSAPVISADGATAEIAIVDSTDTGHGQGDPRTPSGPTGIGEGTVVLLLAGDGTATGFRWSTDADSPSYTTPIAMVHLD